MPDPRVQRGMEAQLRRWRALVAGGTPRIGWKVGLNDPRMQQYLGLEESTLGHLTLATALVPGTPHSLAGATRVGVEPEIAIHLGHDVPADAAPPLAAAAVIGLGAALELVDIDGPLDDVERMVAGNMFHRAVLFGVTHPERAGGDLGGITVSARRDGAEVARVEAVAAIPAVGTLVCLVARTLAACGERLLAGDRIISGSLTAPVWVQPGETASAEFGPLGTLELRFTA